MGPSEAGKEQAQLNQTEYRTPGASHFGAVMDADFEETLDLVGCWNGCWGHKIKLRSLGRKTNVLERKVSIGKF